MVCKGGGSDDGKVFWPDDWKDRIATNQDDWQCEKAGLGRKKQEFHFGEVRNEISNGHPSRSIKKAVDVQVCISENKSRLKT